MSVQIDFNEACALRNWLIAATGGSEAIEAAENAIWDKVVKTCRQAWPNEKGPLVWNGSPVELIVQIIDERDDLREELSTLRAPTGGEGYRLVPVEPTMEMQFAGNKARLRYLCNPGSGLVSEPLEEEAESYRAMLAAAPQVGGRE